MAGTADVAGLMDLGLTRYEAQGYLALIGRGEATPAEIARLASIPRQRVYDVLSALSERAMVSMVPGRTTRYTAQPPDQVLDRLLAVRRRELDRLSTTTAELGERLTSRFLDGQERGGPLDYVEVLRDRGHAVERVEQLWDKAEEEVLTFVRPPYLAPPEVEDATVPTVVSKRAVYELSLLDDLRLAQLVQAYARLGEDIRLAPSLPMKLTIVDGRSVAFNMPDPVEGDSMTTLVVHHEKLATTLKIAFETVWAGAQSLDDALARQRR
jgi:HTH-type transcriptional regulator, sugar sensing transcriptional regulator